MTGNSTNQLLLGSELGNTSQVGVFSDVDELKEDFPNFVRDVIPVSMRATLGPGDVLFFPPGWWHAMKSESTSFSFSMWF
jgi:lysine-specific demethylase 8